MNQSNRSVAFKYWSVGLLLSLWAVLVFDIILLPPTIFAGEVHIERGVFAKLPVRSLKELRDANVVKQSLDYSCGSAALATIFKFYYGENVSENDILRIIFLNLSGDDKKIREKDGVSLFDLQNVSLSLGYQSDGYKLPQESLGKIDRPVIVYIYPRGYKHFSVLKGINNGRVYLADPARGNIRMSIASFLNIWLNKSNKGIIFALEKSKGKLLKNNLGIFQKSNHPQPELLSVREMISTSSQCTCFPILRK
jgi:uncharacterized protein